MARLKLLGSEMKRDITTDLSEMKGFIKEYDTCYGNELDR